MPYQVIARKYRPQTFDEITGQPMVSETLKNAIRTGRVAHGYIFSGARGVGKTTMARVLAKSLNCVQGPTVTPCGQCASCLEITAGNSVDVLEIDAASNRGIDEIRELRQNVRYLPARDRYKVFIIDEVHMLTTEAFNALLKTLEEPPERSLFILATTEAHKLPATIQSRCQHFAFRLLDYSEILSRLREICGREGVKASDGALSLLAEAGDGSLRDALSLLDQVIAACGERLEEDRVRQLLGVVSAAVLSSMVEAIQSGDTAGVLDRVNQVASEGQDLAAFCGELTRYTRNLMVARSCGVESPLLQVSDYERATLGKLSALLGEEDLTRYFQVLLRAQNEMRYSPRPRFHLELALLKLAHAPKLVAIERLLSALKAQSSPARSGGGAAPPPSRPTTPSHEPRSPDAPPWKRAATASTSRAADAPNGSESSEDMVAGPAADEVSRDSRFSAIKAVLFEQSKFLSSCLNPVVGWRFEDGQVYFTYSREGSWAAELLNGREHQEKLRLACEKVLGEPVKIRVTLSTEAVQPAARLTAQQRAERDPLVGALQKRFDCVLMDVKDLSGE